MSLINDALRKAQGSQQPPAQMGATGGGHPQGQPQHARMMQVMIIMGALVLLLGGAVALLAVLVLRQPAPATVEQPAAPAAVADIPAPSPVPVEPPAQAAPAPQPVVAEPPPAAPVETPQPTVAALPEPPAPPPPAAPRASEAATAAPAPALPDNTAVPTQGRQDPELADWVKAIEVRGVMTGSGKALLVLPGYPTAVRVAEGELIHAPSGLRLTRVTSNTLMFTDNAGNQYARRI